MIEPLNEAPILWINDTARDHVQPDEAVIAIFIHNPDQTALSECVMQQR